jgi:hypothetical protein
MNNQLKLIAHIKKRVYDKFGVPTREELLELFKSFKKIPIEYHTDYLGLDNTLINWDEIEDLLLTEIAVKHEIGVGIEDVNEKYDKNWFTKYRKENAQLYYWDRFQEKQKAELPPKVLFTLSQDTEQVLNLCGDPKRNEQSDIRGLVFGFVQSGKTLNYVSIANAAMDAGYHMIVILAGATNILRKQTQERVIADMIGWNGIKDTGVAFIDNDPKRRPTSLTTIDLDFDKKIAQQKMGDYTLETVKVPVIAVIKKNVYSLKNLNGWLNSQNRSGKIEKSILLIDDESDYASVNTRDENNPTSVNRAIREMLNHFKTSTYLAITATPFANILIDIDNRNDIYGSDLFPRSFIWTLNKPSTYMGVKEIVTDRFRNIDEGCGRNEFHQDDNLISTILRFKKESNFDSLPSFVFTAIEDFIYNCVKIRSDLNYTGDLSMMVNMSRFTRHHQELAELIYNEIQIFKMEIRIKFIENCSHPSLQAIFKLFKSDQNFNCSIHEFNKIVQDVILNIDVIDVHSESKREISFSGQYSTNHIVVGGLSLSRGFTIEGLIVSVFVRSTKIYDALMQMGRWFGHKRKFEKYISIHTTPAIKLRFEAIQNATEDLIEQLSMMRKRNETPSEFGLAIQLDPEIGMQVVSANRSKDAQKMSISLSIDGKLCETTKLWIDNKKQLHNETITDELLLKIWQVGKNVNSNDVYLPGGRNKYAFQDIPIKYLVDYIMNFDIPHKLLSQITNKMPYYFLERHLIEFCKSFDFLIVEGDGEVPYELPIGLGKLKPSQRIFVRSPDNSYIQLKNNQLSTGSGEESAFLIKKEDLRRDARIARSIQYPNKPLMLLYRIHARIQGEDDSLVNAFEHQNSTMWGWAIMIPETGIKRKQKIAYANSVLLKQLVLEDGFEYEADYFNSQNINEE